MGIMIICTLVIAAIIYGLYKVKVASDTENMKKAAENLMDERKQRTQWASEVKQKALSVHNICEANNKNISPLVSGTYKADAQMELILSELANAAELKGKIDAMAKEVRKGDSK